MDESQAELEKPMKVYQGKAIQSEVSAVRKLIESQNDMLKATVSTSYMEERLKAVDEKFDAKIKSVQQEYRPVLGNARWVARTAVAAFVSVILMVIGIYLKA